MRRQKLTENRQCLVAVKRSRAIEFLAGWFVPSGAVGLMDGVVSQGFAGCRATEQKHPRSLKQDRRQLHR